MRELYLTYLNRLDVEAAALADEEIIAAIEAALAMQGRGEAVIEPRVHLEPKSGSEGHFNVLRGFVGGRIGMAGVKVVGDFVGNYARDLPSELGLLCLRAHVEAGKLTAETLHAELGQIVAGLRPGRETSQETILFWHRGLSLSDIALGHAMLAKAASIGAGQRLRYS